MNYDKDDILSDIPKVDDYDIMDYKRTRKRGDEDMKIAPERKAPSRGRTSQNYRGGVQRTTGQRATSQSSQRSTVSRSSSSNRTRRTGNSPRKPVQKPKKNGDLGCLGKIIYLIVILAVSILLSIFVVNVSCDVFGIFQEDSSVSIEIPKKASGDEVSKILYDKNIIEYKWAFNIIQKIKKVSSYEGGKEIVLNRKTDYNTLIKKMRSTNSERETVRITFPEGYSLEQMLQLLEENKVCSVTDMKSQMDSVEYDYKFISEMSGNSDILYKYEGYLFPDTYDFYVEDTPQSVYSKFLSNLENKLEDKYYSRAKELDMSMHDVITLASIIQKESSKVEEMATVSSVFHNRLKIGKKLQSDVTVWYPYYKKSDVPQDILSTFSSKYNTYSVEGLPPGPICNPGLSAIEAVLYPDSTDYYYFVTDVNGKYYYATTFEKHKENCAVALSKGEIGGTETE